MTTGKIHVSARMHAVRSYPTVSKIIDQLKSNSKHYKLYLCVLAIGIIIG